MTALSRRRLGGLALGGALLRAPPARANPVPPAKSLFFKVTRNGSTIGTHELVFAQDGDELAVQIDVRLHVGLGPFTFFRYRHQGEERWRGGQFVSLQTHTDDDGDQLHVHAQRRGDHIHVEATGLAPCDLPGTALPLTHWNVACMQARLFNPQDGSVMQETSTPRGNEMVTLANGTRVEATHYALAGKSAMEDWYDEQQVWTALRATAKDGSVLHYFRVNP